MDNGGRSRSRSRDRRSNHNSEEGHVASDTRRPSYDDRNQSRGANRSIDGGNNLYITNLSFQTTEESLRDFFKVLGEVSNASVVREPQTQSSRGFGFVSFVDNADSERAVMELNGKELDSRIIRVEKARRASGYEKTPGRYLGPPQVSAKFGTAGGLARDAPRNGGDRMGDSFRGDGDRTGSDRMGSDRLGSDRMGSDRMGSERMGSDRMGSDRMVGDRMSRDRMGGDRDRGGASGGGDRYPPPSSRGGYQPVRQESGYGGGSGYDRPALLPREERGRDRDVPREISRDPPRYDIRGRSPPPSFYDDRRGGGDRGGGGYDDRRGAPSGSRGGGGRDEYPPQSYSRPRDDARRPPSRGRDRGGLPSDYDRGYDSRSALGGGGGGGGYDDRAPPRGRY